MERRNFTKAERLAVYEKYNGHCAYCGGAICLNKIEDKLWELEGYCLQKELANA